MSRYAVAKQHPRTSIRRGVVVHLGLACAIFLTAACEAYDTTPSFTIVPPSTTTGPVTATTVPGNANLPPALSPVGLGEDPNLEVLAAQCFGGDMAVCDTLFAQAEVGSRYESYGDSCGGRNEPGPACADTYAIPAPIAGEDLLAEVEVGTWVGALDWSPYFTVAAAKAEELRDAEARFLPTNSYRSLTPGYWLVYVGSSPMGPDAGAVCLELLASAGCYQALVADEALMAVSGPPFGAWTVILGSYSADESGRDDAIDKASSAAGPAKELANTLPTINANVGVLMSTDYPSLNPGYWVPFAGQFANQDVATRFCEGLKASEAGISDCAARPLTAWATP